MAAAVAIVLNVTEAYSCYSGEDVFSVAMQVRRSERASAGGLLLPWLCSLVIECGSPDGAT